MNRIKQKYSYMGVSSMKGISIDERAIELAHYIIDSKDTVRGAAKKFGISKSTVHTDLPKVENFKIPSSIVLARGMSWSPETKVSIAVRVWNKYKVKILQNNTKIDKERNNEQKSLFFSLSIFR